MFERACDLTKRLTRCLSGDPMPAHPAALLRIEGTHNTKRGEPILVKPLWGSGTPVDLTDLEDMVDQLPDGGIFTHKPCEPRASTSAPVKHTPGVPVDIEARLAAMKLGGGLEGVHMTQLDCAREMMETGSSVEFAVDFILEATRAAVGEEEFSRWNVAKERLWLEEKCYSWVTKNPRLSATLPKKLREQFETKHARGEEPVIVRDSTGKGWYARKKRGPSTAGLHLVGGTDTERPAPEPELKQAPEAEPEPEFKPSPLGWVLYDADDIQPTNWIVKNVLGESGVLILPGQWGVYKTTSLLQLSYSIMTGKPFAGEYAINLPGAVMLYALEAPKAVNARVKAIATFLEGEARRLPLWRHEECPPLSAPSTPRALIEGIREVNGLAMQNFGVPVRVLWIDNYSIAAGHSASGDDNDRAATAKVFAGLRAVTRETGILIGVVDHYGKVVEAGTTGSAAKEAAADTVLANLADRDLSGALTNTRMVIRKQRDGVSGIEIPFDPVVVEVGTDQDGDAITAVALHYHKPRMATVKRKPSPNDDILEKALATSLKDQGFVQRVDVELEATVVYEDTVRETFYEMMPRGDGTEQQYLQRRAMNFTRALKKAVSHGLVMRRELGAMATLYRPADIRETDPEAAA